MGFNDTNTVNNTSTVNVTVEPRYDLEITKTDGLTTVATGQTITYTLSINNSGQARFERGGDRFPASYP